MADKYVVYVSTNDGLSCPLLDTDGGPDCTAVRDAVCKGVKYLMRNHARCGGKVVVKNLTRDEVAVEVLVKRKKE